jgi:hypothetical protein
MKKHWLAAALVAIVSACPAATANAAVILITQAKAQAGNVTPGDAAGFPVWITQPGSYRLDTNLTGTVNQSVIEVRAPDVTIDLNGFRIDGAGVAYNGILGRPDASGVTVRNGTISGFRVNGIKGTGEFWTVENMRIIENGRDGIRTGWNSQIRDNTVSYNGAAGIACGEYCHVEGNIASKNLGLAAIEIGQGTALGNTITGNAQYGLWFGVGAFGNNTLISNHNGDLTKSQYFGAASQLNPNHCNPACPP